MEVIEISEDNIEEFISLIGEDMADNLGRIFFRGIGAKDDNDVPVGAFIYELIGAESDQDIKSVIRLAKSDCGDTDEKLLKYYKDDSVINDDITESFYEFEDEKIAEQCEAAGFSKNKRESVLLKLKLSDFADSEFAKKRKIPDYIKTLKDISLLEYRAAVKDMLFRGQKGLVEDLAYLPKSWFDTDLSVCSTTDRGVDGIFLVRTTPSGVLIPVLYYAYGPYFTKNLAYMLIKSLEQAFLKYPPETQIMICRTKKATCDMMKKIMPNAKGDEVFCGSRKE